MTERYFLDMEDVLTLHRTQLARFGGAVGVRDAGLIEAALARPQSGYYGDLIEEATALWESLTMNHGFVDGNKRSRLADWPTDRPTDRPFLHPCGVRTYPASGCRARLTS